MTHSLTWFDRLRIEWVVWSLDQRLYDLPRRSRVATRREVRESLLTAAADVGTKEALVRLGSSHQLAVEYRNAEFGDAPRPSWWAAGLFLLNAQLLFTLLLTEATLAFGDGIAAGNPSATGTFKWEGISYLQDSVTYTFVDGQSRYVGGAWTPLAWALWLAGAIMVGRLWHVASVWRRRRSPIAA